MAKKITLLGSTGSIGTQSLDGAGRTQQRDFLSHKKSISC